MYKTEVKALSDGTLYVTVDLDISTINRVLLSQKGTHWGELYYSDALQPERKRGKWVKVMEGNAYRDQCDQCKASYPNAYGYNYCPNCGANMEDGDERSDQ